MEGAPRNEPIRIVYDGRHYCYGPYRYDRFADAVRYAYLERSRGAAANDDPWLREAQVDLPTPAEDE